MGTDDDKMSKDILNLKSLSELDRNISVTCRPSWKPVHAGVEPSIATRISAVIS